MLKQMEELLQRNDRGRRRGAERWRGRSRSHGSRSIRRDEACRQWLDKRTGADDNSFHAPGTAGRSVI